MISLIISTPNEKISDRLQKNIADTIGNEFEIITIENKNAFSLAAAYNKGAAQAAYDYVCFVHDDVTLLTPNWGSIAIHHIQHSADLIGLAGSACKTSFITGWCSGPDDANHFHIFHETPKGPEKWSSKSRRPGGELFPVITLDGVWLFCRKDYWQQLKFNEDVPGFHFYDIDFSLRSSQVGRNAIVFDIDLVHYSKGNFGDAWLESAFSFHKQWANKLPMQINGLAVPTDGWASTAWNQWKALMAGNLSAANKKRLLDHYKPWFSKWEWVKAKWDVLW